MANQTKEEKSAGAPPALFEHCLNVYKAMFEHASAVANPAYLTDSSGDGEPSVVVYEGFLTQLITGELNLSVPYYTQVMTALKNMGCVRQLRRGGSTTESQWELIYEPTLDAFMKARPAKKRTITAKDIRDQRLDQLEKDVRELLQFKSATLDFLAQKFGTEEVKEENDE